MGSNSTTSHATREPVKVVLIDTYYVEADPTSFKSIVQSLTGMHSRLLESEGSLPEGTRATVAGSTVDSKAAAAAPRDCVSGNPVMQAEVSFGDAGPEWWMQLELPQDEGLGWLLAES